MPAWLAVVLSWLLRLYAATLRVSYKNNSSIAVEELGKYRVALALWHNRVIFAAVLAPKIIRSWISPLISASRDGNYIAVLAERLGYSPIRGSSSRGGAVALLQLQEELSRNRVPLITVDGPRGPRYTVHRGIVRLGMENGAAIVPVSLNFSHYWYLKNWDCTQIPVPFSKVEMIFGEQVILDKDMDIDEGCRIVGEALQKDTKDLYGEVGKCRDKR